MEGGRQECLRAIIIVVNSCEREKAKTTLLSRCKKPREKMEAGRKLHGTRTRFQHSNQPGLTRIDSNLTARRPDPPAAMDAFARS